MRRQRRSPNNLMADPNKQARADEPQEDAWPESLDHAAAASERDAAAADQAAPLQQADDEAERLRCELDEASRRLLMAQAELENFRKPVRRDYEEQIRYAAVPLLQDILQVRDNLARALDVAASPDASAGDGLRDGVAIVAKQLEDSLAKHGCQRIAALGEAFDPNVHEAISQMPSDQYAAGQVAHEAVVGYRLHDRVIRPSQVVVSTGPAAS